MKKILAIGAHQDDIEIGCAGTLMKFIEKGDLVSFIVFTDGGNWSGKDREVRLREQKLSCEKLGVNKLYHLDQKDGYLESNPEMIDVLREIISKESPDFIFTHHYNDSHQDHRTVFRITNSSCRECNNILMYQSITSSNFSPTVFCDISENFDGKIDVLNCFSSQVEKYKLRDEDLIEKVKIFADINGSMIHKSKAEGFVPIKLSLDEEANCQ